MPNKYVLSLLTISIAGIVFAQTNQQSAIQSQQEKVDFSRPPNIKAITAMASNGDPYCQGLLGLYYFRGYFIQSDKEQAKYWAKLSAEKSHPFGLYCLGRLCEKQAEKANDYFQKSLTNMIALADSGDAEAQIELGSCYYRGLGVSKDLTKAVEWEQKAAEQGYAFAQNYLGLCYYNGWGVSKDLTKAVELFRKAAEQGYAQAQCYLAVSYANGEGIRKDLTKAAGWFQKAADQGLAEAQAGLGVCYAKGKGVPKDLTKAAEWSRKAAEQGNAVAQHNLKTIINGWGLSNFTKLAERLGLGNMDAQYSLENNLILLATLVALLFAFLVIYSFIRFFKHIPTHEDIPTPKETTIEEKHEGERFNKIVSIQNEFQGQILAGILKENGIPHIIRNYNDSAYDGVFQLSQGWGCVEAPLQFKEEILSLLKELDKTIPRTEDTSAKT